MKYIFDTNVLITAKNTYYAFDVVPGFWQCLDEFVKRGVVASIDKVKMELDRSKDELTQWVDEHISNAFKSTDSVDVVREYRKIIPWVNSQEQFLESAQYDFARGADGWLVAYAKVKQSTVVTNEAYNPERKNKVPIPNVCQEFSVAFINTFDLLKELGVQFFLMCE